MSRPRGSLAPPSDLPQRRRARRSSRRCSCSTGRRSSDASIDSTYDTAPAVGTGNAASRPRRHRRRRRTQPDHGRSVAVAPRRRRPADFTGCRDAGAAVDRARRHLRGIRSVRAGRRGRPGMPASDMTPDGTARRDAARGRVVLGYGLTFDAAPLGARPCVLHPLGARHHPSAGR